RAPRPRARRCPTRRRRTRSHHDRGRPGPRRRRDRPGRRRARPQPPGALPENGKAEHPPGMTPPEPPASARAGRRRSSMVWPTTAAPCALVAAALVVELVLREQLDDPVVAGAITAAIAVPLAMYVVRRTLVPMTAMFRVLAGTVTSYRDGDFAFSLAWKPNDELGDLVAAHNALGDTLRSQRESLIHRELLLDTMVQNTPVAMLLCDPGGHIVYGNLAAR